MKTVRVEVLAVRETEQVSGNIFVEKQKGETWNRTRVISVVSGEPESLRTILLEDDERLVIEGKSRKIIEYDREQNAAKIADADPEVREAQKRADAATKEANVLREQKTGEVKPQVAAAAAAAQPRTNIGNPAPSRPTGQQATGQAQTTTKPFVPPSTTQPKPGGEVRDHGQGVTGTKESSR